MTTHDISEQAEQHYACFLCALDPQRPCKQAKLEGTIVAAYERTIQGVRTPVLILDTGADRVEVRLPDQYYRSLIYELKLREDEIRNRAINIRVYHLPIPPTPVSYKGSTRSCYTANSYTLAVIEPDILLNITDLSIAEYCPRQYMLNRLSPSSVSAATIRGNLVHYCFKELLKEHDRSRSSSDDRPYENPLNVLQKHLEQALHLHSIDLALARVSASAIRSEVAPHLESLARWYESEHATLWDMTRSEDDPEHADNQVRAETFLLAPEIGLRGRLDLFWKKAGQQRLLELKTGGANGDLPKREHRWQVHGYHALLTVRRNSKMKRAQATLLYTGTPEKAHAIGLTSTIRELQRVNERRNILLLAHITTIPPAPPGPARCNRCAMLTQCQTVSSLLQWQAPETDNHTPPQQRDTGAAEAPSPSRPAESTQLLPINTDEDRVFFARYFQLLQEEGRAGEQQQALLWQIPVAQRLERGTAINGLEPEGVPEIDKDGWVQTFRCHNTSELREGDEVLLSRGDPITGEVVTGTIVSISLEHVTVWTRESIASPTLIDRYDNDLVHVRTLQNLLRWLQADRHMRDLVAGKIRPRFVEKAAFKRPDFNREQNLAVERAMQMQDYLLIHGPPGTGKTSVIAEIVKQLCARGQRVLLAAFTNQAVDNMLKRLDKEGFHDYLRLGHERSVEESIRPRLLKEVVRTLCSGSFPAQQTNVEETVLHAPETLHDLLSKMPVVASTTASWSSDKYTAAPDPSGEEPAPATRGMDFDVAIIDEAGQLTIPAILGALRFARRFILVGDEKQLPPLVLNQVAAEQGLGTSLFSALKQQDNAYTQRHPLAISACVPLRLQYRMNKWISHFCSTVFYEKQLLPHESVANRRLSLAQARRPVHQQHESIAKTIEPAFPLVFMDVRDDIIDSAQKISHAEARAVRAIIGELLLRGIEQQDIGVIAPYRAQVANIRRHLFSSDSASGWQALTPDSPLSVDTVDRFQGGERSIIIMSFATVSEPAVGSQRRDFLVNAHRLNVALTRAQRKLILVGNVAALEHLPIFSRLITYCRSMNTVIAYGESSAPILL